MFTESGKVLIEVFLSLLIVSQAHAQPCTERELAGAINAWTGPSKYVNWFECGTKENRFQRSREYASAIIQASKLYKHRPSIVAAILEQESGYDRCQVGRPSRRVAGLPIHPSKAQVVKAYGTAKARKKNRVTRVDVGAAQFLWPYGAPYGVTNDVELGTVLTLSWTVDALGRTLAKHRERTKGRERYGSRFLSPIDYYWTLHHSYKMSRNYYANVSRRAKRLHAKCMSIREGT